MTGCRLAPVWTAVSDGIVVAINAAPESRTLQDFAGTSLQLSAIQQGGGRPVAGERRAGAADGSGHAAGLVGCRSRVAAGRVAGRWPAGEQ